MYKVVQDLYKIYEHVVPFVISVFGIGIAVLSQRTQWRQLLGHESMGKTILGISIIEFIIVIALLVINVTLSFYKIVTNPFPDPNPKRMPSGG